MEREERDGKCGWVRGERDGVSREERAWRPPLCVHHTNKNPNLANIAVSRLSVFVHVFPFLDTAGKQKGRMEKC